MSQFDLYANTNKETHKTYPYFVEVQNDILESLNSRIVIPLTAVTKTEKPYPENLCPVINIEGKKFILLTQQMTTIPISFLKKKERSLAKYRIDIISAIDFLITGI